MPSSWITALPATARKPLRYQAVYRDATNSQRSAGVFATKREAKSALALITVTTEAGTWIDPSQGKTTVADFAAQWLAGKNVAESTAAKLAGQVRREILPVWGDKQLKAIKTGDVRAWVVTLAIKHEPETVRGLVQTFRSMLNVAVTDGYLSTNPVKLAKGDLPRLEESDKMLMSTPQLEALVANVHEHYRTLVHLTAWTGLRWGEVAALRWEDVDYDAGLVRVTRAVSNGLHGRGYYGPPKTESSRRELGVDRETQQLLRKHRMKMGGKDLVFRTLTGQPIRSSYFRSKIWNPAVRATFADGVSGLERSCPVCQALPGLKCRNAAGQSTQTHKPRYAAKLPTFHDLRHSHLTNLLIEGIDPMTVAQRAGHSDPATTLNIYGRLRPDHVKAVTDAIDRLRGTA